LSRGCSFEKPKAGIATDNLDIADLFDDIPRTGIAADRGLPYNSCAVRVYTGTHCTFEEVLTNGVRVHALPIFSNEAKAGH